MSFLNATPWVIFVRFALLYFALWLGIAATTSAHAQTETPPINDVYIVLYEKTSRMGVVGNVLGALLSKDSVTGTIYIDPFGLHKSRSNKVVKVCYLRLNNKPLSDDELIASNLKSSIGGNDALYDMVGSEKVQFNVFGSSQELGTGLVKNECDYIAVASTETAQVENTIKSVDEHTDKTYKPVADFKVSSSVLWSKPEPGKPISREEYLAIAWCGFPSAGERSTLQNLNLKSPTSCKEAQNELAASGYAPGANYSASTLISYVTDRAEGKKANQSAEQVRIARDRAAEAEKRRLQASRYPYYAVISCLDRGRQINIPYCMFGQDQALNGEVKIQTDGRTRLYTHMDFEEIPSVVDLTNKFSIVAQNASSYFILEIKVFETLTGKQVYSDQVGRFGVIKVGN